MVGAATWAALPKADEEPSVPTSISLTGDGMRALFRRSKAANRRKQAAFHPVGAGLRRDHAADPLGNVEK
ncbi:MAG: hypothetical protein ACLUI3_12310 [Christensenellales bacterium]